MASIWRPFWSEIAYKLMIDDKYKKKIQVMDEQLISLNQEIEETQKESNI